MTMCELMTIAAALVFTAVFFFGKRSKAAFTAMLMFWGKSFTASLAVPL